MYSMLGAIHRRFFNCQVNAISIVNGNRVALSRAITLIESFKEEHVAEARNLLHELAALPKEKMSFRIGIAGPPGAGKSTFIEAFGSYILRNEDNKVAVLAIDPSSSRTKGSILGDKTRMDTLSHHLRAFVRPSPTSGKLGGIAEHTSDVIELCERAGYNYVIVETVGLGQNEVLVDEVVDFVIMLTPPQMGDDLQGVKKGIMEIADMVVVNKADGALETVAKHARTEYMHTFQLLQRKHKNWLPPVALTSALNALGVSEVFDICTRFQTSMNQEIHTKRLQQKSRLIWSSILDEVTRRLKQSSEIKSLEEELTRKVQAGTISSRQAASEIVQQAISPNIYRK